MLNYCIKNGQLLDGIGAPPISADLRIRNGRIADIGPNLPPEGDQVIDATGLLVCPGLVDLHVHVFSGVGVFSLDPAEAGLRTGVTTMLDTGTAGALTYDAFERFVMPAATEDVFALLNISMIGCIHRDDIAPYFSDLTDVRFVSVEDAVACLRQHRNAGRLLGTKARLTWSMAGYKVENERAGLYGAIEAAAQTGTRFMLHHVRSEVPVAEVLAAMRPGDIYTHTYHSSTNGPFSDLPGRAPVEAARRARDRGVLFDVGHGMGSFVSRTAEPACRQHGFWPDSISTDLHAYCIRGPAYDMPTTMSRFLHMGMPLERVVHAATQAPARAMGLEDRFGRLAVGRQADVTLLRLDTGSWALEDVEGDARTVRKRLFAVEVFKRGERRSLS